MKRKNGFTLIELLAVIVIIAIIALIAVPLILNVIETSNKGAAKASAYAYIDAVEKYQILCTIEKKECLKDGNYLISDVEIALETKKIIDYIIPKVYALDEETYVEGIYLNDILNLKGEKPKGGYLSLKGDKVISGEGIWNGYSATYDGKIVEIGSKFIPGEDTSKPVSNLIYSKKTSNSVTFIGSCSDSGSGITKYEFYLDGILKETFNTSSTTKAFTFSSLISKNYEFKIVCTNGVSLSSESIVNTNPNEIITPTYSLDKDGLAKSKILTINYPEREEGYIYSYSLDDGNTWIILNDTISAIIPFANNGNVIARIYDGINYKTASSYTISGIDNTDPIVTIGVSNKTTNKISVEAIASDLESDIIKYEFQIDTDDYVDNGLNNIFTYSQVKEGSHTLKVRVTNGANSIAESIIEASTTEIIIPTYSVSPEGFAMSKTVTITYPEREEDYIYSYSLDEGATWIVVSDSLLKSIIFEENGSVIARIYDGTNYKTASTYTISSIDKVAPTISSKQEFDTIGKLIDIPVANLFDIGWSISGEGTLNCFDENNNQVINTNVFDFGAHSVTCSATGNNGLISDPATKNITVVKGTDPDYQLLYDAGDLSNFRNLVNSGSNSLNARLMSNINLTLIGSLYSKPMIVSGMSRNVNTFTTTTTDPQLVFSNLSLGRTCGGTVKFTSALTASMNFQAFYVNASKPLSETNSVKKTVASGIASFDFIIPCGDYTTLRLDFGNVSGISFTINEIRYFDNWTPIGDQYITGKSFKGIFDGNNKTINNIYVNDSSGNYKGLFGINEGTIKDLSLTGVVSSTIYTGGIAGKNSGTITNCTNNSTIWGLTDSGGIAGYNTGIISYSTNNGSINSYGNNIGGITGNNSGQLNYSQNTGVIICYAGQGSGGLTGVNGEGSTLTKSYNKGSVSGIYDVGGVAGFNYKGTISDSYNRGVVTATGANGTNSFAGGIAGDNNAGTIIRVYNIGNVTASVTKSGGITGASYSTSSISNSYSNGVIKAATFTASGNIGGGGNNYAGFIIGYNSSGTYSNVGNTISLSNLGSNFKADSNNINNGYPILIWQ